MSATPAYRPVPTSTKGATSGDADIEAGESKTTKQRGAPKQDVAGCVAVHLMLYIILSVLVALLMLLGDTDNATPEWTTSPHSFTMYAHWAVFGASAIALSVGIAVGQARKKLPSGVAGTGGGARAPKESVLASVDE